MKRLALYTAAMVFAISGALMAQEPNSSAPGQTSNPQPNTANNDLANPGSQMAQPSAQPGTAVQDSHPGNTAQGATGSSYESTTAQNTGSTTSTTGTTPQTGTQGNGVTGGTTATTATPGNDTTGMAGTSSTTTTTGTTPTTTTGGGSNMDSTTGSTGTDTTGTSGSTTLPRTASDMPLVGLAGLLALSAGVALRSRS